MDSRGKKDNLKTMILDMARKELDNHGSQKGAQKYFEGNIDKIIIHNINKYERTSDASKDYSRIMVQGAYQENVSSIIKMLKKEELLKSKNELVKFARHLGIKASPKSSYNQLLKRVCSTIFSNREIYKKKYIIYTRGKNEYILEPEKIKLELVQSYKSKTREDMKSIAKLLSINIDEEEGAEDIRKKVINYIVKEKISKKYKN